jgi:hypothetical protein
MRFASAYTVKNDRIAIFVRSRRSSLPVPQTSLSSRRPASSNATMPSTVFVHTTPRARRGPSTTASAGSPSSASVPGTEP